MSCQLSELTSRHHVLTSSVDGEENRPSDQGADEADGGKDLEQSEKQIIVQGRVVKNVIISDAAVVCDPAESTRRWLRSPLTATYQHKVGCRGNFNELTIRGEEECKCEARRRDALWS